MAFKSTKQFVNYLFENKNWYKGSLRGGMTDPFEEEEERQRDREREQETFTHTPSTTKPTYSDAAYDLIDQSLFSWAARDPGDKKSHKLYADLKAQGYDMDRVDDIFRVYKIPTSHLRENFKSTKQYQKQSEEGEPKPLSESRMYQDFFGKQNGFDLNHWQKMAGVLKG